MLNAFSPQKASIIITPRSARLAQTTALLLTLHPSAPADLQLTKILVSAGPVVTTAQASGTQSQEARTATGSVTYFNISSQTQQVQAGIVLTASNGMKFLTDAGASVPGGNPPDLGQATVPAHALSTGLAGNIPIGGINEDCCTPTITAKNMTPFTGGQDGKVNPIVQPKDIQQAADPLASTQLQKAQSLFNKQVAGRAVLSSTCTKNVSPDHPAGSVAKSVTITISATCIGYVYDTQAARQIASSLLVKQAQALGTAYHLQGSISVQIGKGLPGTTPQTWTLPVATKGLWIYQLSLAQFNRLAPSLTNVTVRAARNTLLQIPGVQTVSIQLAKDANDPNALIPDAQHITITLAHVQ